MKNHLLLNLAGLLLVAAISFSFKTAELTAGAESGLNPWEMLGMRRVNYGLDRDEIAVTRAEGIFTALQIRVKGSPINMHKIVVHFGNGETQEFELRENFRAGSASRVLDLPGNRRVIRKVVFWYDTKNLAGRKAVVQLWGRH
ncbi:MAG: hypothetical protein JNL02_01205 [Saprospiraceae bacterium]|nr:hypothetical protein [Saprospiraceae bacterium]